MTIRIEVLAIVDCDMPGCRAELATPGGVAAAFDLASKKGWTATYDRLKGGHRHRCPRHRVSR